MVPLCLIWLKNMKKMLLQVTSGFFCNLSELYDSIYVISDDSKSVTHEAEIVSACDLHCYVVYCYSTPDIFFFDKLRYF
jgi:hypothetical protein